MDTNSTLVGPPARQPLMGSTMDPTLQVVERQQETGYMHTRDQCGRCCGSIGTCCSVVLGCISLSPYYIVYQGHVGLFEKFGRYIVSNNGVLWKINANDLYFSALLSQGCIS